MSQNGTITITDDREPTATVRLEREPGVLVIPQPEPSVRASAFQPPAVTVTPAVATSATARVAVARRRKHPALTQRVTRISLATRMMDTASAVGSASYWLASTALSVAGTAISVAHAVSSLPPEPEHDPREDDPTDFHYWDEEVVARRTLRASRTRDQTRSLWSMVAPTETVTLNVPVSSMPSVPSVPRRNPDPQFVPGERGAFVPEEWTERQTRSGRGFGGNQHELVQEHNDRISLLAARNIFPNANMDAQAIEAGLATPGMKVIMRRGRGI